jgi:hypothetical protein
VIVRGLRGLLVTLVAIVLIGGVGLVSWDRWWHHAGPTNPGFSCPEVVKARHRLPLTATHVHRVALIGDSIMVQASCAIADSLADLGIQTSRHAVSGSGLLVGLDWVAQMQTILRSEHPDAVIAIFNGNYLFATAAEANGAPIKAGTPAFFRAWQQRAEQLSAEVRAGHAEMYWVSPPPITAPALKDTSRLFDGYRTIAGDHFLFSGHVLAGPNGGLTMTKVTCGHRRAIRTPDRVHLTEDGARIYGQQIAHDFSADNGVLTAPQPC